MNVVIDNTPIDVAAGQTCAQALAQVLSNKKLKRTLACECASNGESRILDMTAQVPEGCSSLTPISPDSDQGLDILRHSAAHVMATAVKKLYPGVKVTIGPAINHGFYYDFDYKRPFTPEDLEAIEAEMRSIVAQDEPFVRRDMSRAEAEALFASMDETYKLEIMADLGADQVSVYTNGEFVDLCRGPHVPSTGALKAFKLTSVAGAYWRGDETRQMLQRIYGTAFADQKALKAHLARLEEAKRRDHRKLGTQMDLFSFHEELGPGMPVWHPKGMLVRTILEDFERKEHLKRGYDIVMGPMILRKELWEKSGHYDNYRENMYFTEVDNQAYGIKPMNCLAHMLIFKSRIRSYRDMPQRYFELGTVHRHEKAGVLHGLMRVRMFTQDDAHLICRPDQLQDEIMGVVRFVQDVMNLFGFTYHVELSTRPDKSIGSDQDWDRATRALESSLKALGLEYQVNEGDGAFYGPKIDIHLQDALERSWQCATIQCDFTLPERFDLYYIGQDGERHRPVMVHRVVLGAVERFIGVLIEHLAGAFPTWLAPVQGKVLTVTDDQNPFALEAEAFFRSKGLRVEADTRNEKLGFKVREAQMEKVPFMFVVGDKEVEAGGVNVRLRSGENLGVKSLEEAAKLVQDDAREPFKRGGMSYSFDACPV